MCAQTTATGNGYAQKTVGRYPADKVDKDTTKPDRFHFNVREHIRALARSGEPQLERVRKLWYPPERNERATAIFDHLSFHPDLRSRIQVVTGVDTSTTLFGRRLLMPLQFGDMSAGALYPNFNISLAQAAELIGILCGTGEGGLLPELYGLKNILVQWASARWGVSEESILQGAGTVIKAGQGAKPIGGQLAQFKLEALAIIRQLRKFQGADANSPAVHADIMSIEDLLRRIKFLQLVREAAGAPPYVGVKVTASKKSGAIACGIGRVGAHAIILDGKKAGTGDTPRAVADNMGLDIEVAVPMVDQMLRMEIDPETGMNLRRDRKIIGGGGLTSALDLAILLALGADGGLTGTGAMVAAGCVKKDMCNTGRDCPAAETNLLLTTAIQIEWARDRLVSFVKGMHAELQAILHALDMKNVEELIGRRDLIYAHEGLSNAMVERLGVKRWKETTTVHSEGKVLYWPWKTEDEKYWSVWHLDHAKKLGKTGLPVKRAMGSQAAPFTSMAHTITDHLSVEPAQITNPQQNSYQEPVHTWVYLGREGQRRISHPILLGKANDETVSAFATAATRTASMFMATEEQFNALPEIHRKNAIVELTDNNTEITNIEGVVLHDSDDNSSIADCIANHRKNGVRLVTVKLKSDDEKLEAKAKFYAKAGVDAIIVDGTLEISPQALEIGLRRAQLALLSENSEGTLLRERCSLLANAPNLRHTGDILKLQALGADAVFAEEAPEIAMQDAENKSQAVTNWVRGSKFELKLQMGGAGIKHASSLIGNRDVVFTVNLADPIQALLDIEAGGMKIAHQDAA